MGAVQRKTVNVDRGLYAVKLDWAADADRTPHVHVTTAAGYPTVEFITHPDLEEPILTNVGDVVVARAFAPSQLTIEIRPTYPSQSQNATVQLERLGAAHVLPANTAEVEPTNLQVLAHVARRGDVRAAEGEWIGGPGNPGQIEGLLLKWPGQTPGVRILYSASAGSRHVENFGPVEIGSFVGTRGRALPLTRLALELVGPEASRYELSLDAQFLNTPVRKTTGTVVVATGTTGREPLIGVRIGLQPVEAFAQPLPHTPSRPRPQRLRPSTLQHEAAFADVSRPVSAPAAMIAPQLEPTPSVERAATIAAEPVATKVRVFRKLPNAATRPTR